MKIFLSYASEDRATVEPIYYALVGDHTVFFDRNSLPEGDDFDARIRKAIRSSDLMIFCISPDSVDQGSYTRTELKFAEKKWTHPAGRVLPIMIRDTDYEAIPGYLKAVTVLETAGNAAAEVADRLHTMGKRRQIRHIVLGVGAVLILALASIFGGKWLIGNSTAEDSPLGLPTATTQLPEPLSLTVTTDDQADQVEIRTAPIDSTAGGLKVCLQVMTESGWWKGIGLNEREPTLEGERSDGEKCTTISPGRIDVSYWKAKTFGVHTNVGQRSLDLTPYGDHEVIFTWTRD